MSKKKKSKKFQFPRGRFLINDQHGQAIHQHDMIFHKNGMQGFVDDVWSMDPSSENEKPEIYFYLDSGMTWAFENISATPFQNSK